jgi:hypothetical protein
LKAWNTKSCGCIRDKAVREATVGPLSDRERLQGIRSSMIQRCTNKKVWSYSRYGGRGIKVCQEWLKDFESFYVWAQQSDYRSDLQLDRIDNDGDYTPKNCRWVTIAQNSRNKHTNYKIEYQGEQMILADWALKLGIDYHVLHHRLRYLGWTVEEAFSNVSSSHNRIKKQIEFNGQSMTAAEWGRELGITGRSILYRLEAGWSIEDALLTPPRKKPKNIYNKKVGDSK